ncbi:MAG: rane-associated zinc metalloprotease [Gemmatimonadetes bacterium]|nr:rane-associated zinc metalloprotease [Gemmatimonadota bacterium]
MLAILAPILVFGLVIFVHELGHFLAAKAMGVYAPRFSIGFGPSLIRFRRGETEYVLAALPLGGYVRMASRHDAEAAFLEGGAEEESAKKATDPGYDPDAMIPFGPKPVPEDRWFESKSLPARIFIMIAGVVMNALLAIVVATGLAFHYGQVVYPSTVVGGVHAAASAPELAQLQSGDTIRAVNGTPVRTWNDVRKGILTSTNSVTLATQRGQVTVPLGRNGATAETVADAVVYYLPPVIDTVFPGEPAAVAGFQHGDSIVSVAGLPVRSWIDMVNQVGASPGRPVTFVIRRGAATDTLVATPKAVQEPDAASGTPKTVGKIGAGTRDPSHRETLPFGEAVSAGMRMTASNAGAVFKVLHDIGSGQQSVKQLGGPIAITRAAVTAARNGVDELFYLIALLSINVAVLNLLPIPILDGGQILINVLESAKGSPFSMRTREYILRFGLFAIALLFAIVMYNDTRAGFVKLFGWVGKLFGA